LKVGASLGKSFLDLKQETLKVRQEYEKTGFKSVELGNKLRELQRATVSAREDAKKYGIEIGKAAQQTKYLETASAQAEARVGRMQARQRRASERSQLRGELKSTLAVGTALFAYPMKTAVSFEQAMAEVGAIARASAEDMKRLEENARFSAKSTQFTSTQTAGAQKNLANMGFNPQEIIESMPGLLDLAAAGSLDLGVATTISTGILNAYNMEKKEMARVGDVLALSAASSGTNIEQMGNAMQYVAPDAAKLGMTLEQTAAAISVLSDANIKGERAGTTFRSMLSHIVRPTKEASDFLDFLGVSTLNAKGELRDIGEILVDMDRAMSARGFGSGEKNRGMKTVFGQEAGTGALVIAEAAGNGKLDKLTEEYNSASGASKEMAERMNATTMGALRRLGSAVEEIGIIVGSAFLPPITDSIEKLAAFTLQVGTFAEKHPRLVKILVGAAAGLVGLKAASIVGRIGFSHLLDGFSLLNGGFQMLRPSTIQATLGLMRMRGVGGTLAKMLAPIANFKAGFVKDVQAVGSGLKWLSKGAFSFGRSVGSAFRTFGGALLGFGKTLLLGIKGVGAALIANPMILAIAVIVGLVAGAAYLIWKNWDRVKVWLSNFWEGIKTKWNAAVTWIGDKIAWIGNAVHSAWENTKAYFLGFWEDIKARWNGAVEWIGGSVSGLGEAIKAPFVSAFGWIGEKIDSIKSKWEGFKSAFSLGGSTSKSFSFTADGTMIPDAGHADGGVFDKPHIAAFAEGGKEEAAIPLEGHRARARSIWAYSGQRLGMFQGAGAQQPAGGGSVTIMPGAIVVNPSPGMDETALAHKVMSLLKQELARKERRSLTDAAFVGRF